MFESESAGPHPVYSFVNLTKGQVWQVELTDGIGLALSMQLLPDLDLDSAVAVNMSRPEECLQMGLMPGAGVHAHCGIP